MKILALKITNKLDDFTLNFLLSTIDERKRERLLKFVFWQDTQRSLFADLLVRKVIMDSFDLKNNNILFKENEFGKPYLDSINNFHFNVSHSGDWVVCAIDEKSVGIDIEKKTTIDLNISKHFFSNKEHEDLMLSNDPFDYFFTLWSLKESYIKFIGKGLSHPLNSFSMKRLGNNKIHIESHDQILENIYFKQYSIDDNYKMAVCTSNPNFPDRLSIYSLQDIIRSFMIPKRIVNSSL